MFVPFAVYEYVIICRARVTTVVKIGATKMQKVADVHRLATNAVCRHGQGEGCQA